MATVNISLTNVSEQERRGIAAVLDAENARRAAQTPPLAALTRNQYLESVMDSAIASYAANVADTDTDLVAIRQALKTATPENIAAVKTTLGL